MEHENEPGTTYLEYVNAADVTPEPIRWTWPSIVPDESVTMISGHGGNGKSLLTTDFVARLSRGRAWPDNLTQTFDPAGAVILNVEDQVAKVTVPRLIAAEADRSRISIIARKVTIDKDGKDVRRPIDVRCDIDRIAGVVDQTPNCKALIVDPITALIGDTESNSVTEVRAAMLALSDLAEEKRIAVIVVSHLTKSTGSAPAMRTLGSIGFTAAARSVWFVIEHPQDKKTRRLFLPAKMNYSAKRDGLGFRVATTHDDVPYILWDSEPATMTLDEAMGGRGAPKQENAEAWLAAYLADGVKLSPDVREAAESADFKWGTVMRAKRSLGVITRKLGMGGGWSWTLPTEEPPDTVLYSSSNIDSVLRDSSGSDGILRRTLSKPEDDALTVCTPLPLTANQDDSDRLEREVIMSVEAEAEAADKNGRGGDRGSNRQSAHPLNHVPSSEKISE